MTNTFTHSIGEIMQPQLLKQYVKPGTLWAFQRNGKTVASCVILKSNIDEWDEWSLGWDATILFGDQIARVHQYHEHCDRPNEKFIGLRTGEWPNGEDAWVCPHEVDGSYMVPFDLLDKNPYPPGS